MLQCLRAAVGTGKPGRGRQGHCDVRLLVGPAAAAGIQERVGGRPRLHGTTGTKATPEVLNVLLAMGAQAGTKYAHQEVKARMAK